MSFKVLHAGEDCWTDIQPDGSETPTRYSTPEEAEQALKEYLVDQHAAVDAGDMLEKYCFCEFVIVPELDK